MGAQSSKVQPRRVAHNLRDDWTKVRPCRNRPQPGWDDWLKIVQTSSGIRLCGLHLVSDSAAHRRARQCRPLSQAGLRLSSSMSAVSATIRSPSAIPVPSAPSFPSHVSPSRLYVPLTLSFLPSDPTPAPPLRLPRHSHSRELFLLDVRARANRCVAHKGRSLLFLF